ncbi:hypothetical protein ACFYXM_25045 [Streptomyces sp. NPDC002476]|uniref:hypothetical protein n=1 Tax=Streptomyces sp. NPDC002476 TaxID=3364648 RepID=UPI0036CC3150
MRVGRELLAYREERAKQAGCLHLNLDSGTHRTDAHRFYLRERLDIVAFHFDKAVEAG